MCSCTETKNKYLNILYVVMQNCCCAITHSVITDINMALKIKLKHSEQLTVF